MWVPVRVVGGVLYGFWKGLWFLLTGAASDGSATWRQGSPRPLGRPEGVTRIEPDKYIE